jgi:calcineurin-like phosphoesterase family protein
MTDYFTADLHFGHDAIIGYVGRPFENTKDMDRILIENWNEIVQPDDTVYVLGDFSMKRTDIGFIVARLRQLNGRKILILGNHDYMPAFDYVNAGFESVHTYFYHERLKVHLTHDPAPATGPESMLWLCGHVHRLFKETRNVLNVGVDVWDFKPVSEQTIVSWMEQKRAEQQLFPEEV